MSDDLNDLPPQPPPAPARREAAIGEAMRRFDGGEAAASAVPPRRPLRTRPQLAGVVAAALVAVVALPAAWFALSRGEFHTASGVHRTMIDVPAPPASGDREAVPAAVPAPEQSRVPVVAPTSARVVAPSSVAGRVLSNDATVSPSAAPPPPPPPAMIAPAPALADAPVVATPPAERALHEARPAELTRGFSISRSQPAPAPAPAPAAKAASSALAREATAAGRQRNEGTVADKLAGRAEIDNQAESRDIVVAAQRRRTGDARSSAVRAHADAQLPKSALGLLDRGLARARAGDSAGALADLDRAVRLAPRSARVHYELGRVLRSRGDPRRAQAEFNRAAELDPAFGELDD